MASSPPITHRMAIRAARAQAWAVGLALMLVCCACGRVHQRHWVQPGGERWEGDCRFDELSVAPDVARMKGKLLAVEVLNPLDTVQAANAKMHKPEDWREYWHVWEVDFEDYLADVLWQSAVFLDVCAPGDANPIEEPDYVCEVAMTEWDEGTGWMRFVIGFGAGATRMQWEGRIIEAASGREVLSFADARVHPGGPSMLGFNLRPFRGQVLISEDVRWAVEDLARALRKLTGTKEKQLPFYKLHKKYRWEGMYDQTPEELVAAGKD